MRWSKTIAIGLLLVSVTALARGQKVSVVLDGRSAGRVFDGIGAASAGASSRLLIDYPEPQRSQVLDYLFKPGYGASLQHLKVEIGADVNSTDGSEPSHMRNASDHNSTRGYEWWLMVEAHRRNPKIVLEVLPWGAPDWVGTAGRDRSLYTSRMAEYVTDFIKTARHDYSLDIAYAGTWNEKVHDIRYTKELHRRLLAEHLHTRIVCCDEYPGLGAGEWSIADDILEDPELADAVDVIGVHYPLVNGKITTTENARKSRKPLWSSEDQPNSGSGPFVSRDWSVGGRILAHLYNQNYLEGSLTSTEIWSPVTSYYDNLAAPNSGLMYANSPWSGHYQVQGAIWATAHTTQFAQPGWQYLDSSSGHLPKKGTYVALRSVDHKNWSMILETIGSHDPQTISFRLTGGLATRHVYVWETNDSHTFERIASLEPRNDEFEFTFDPDSLYSLTTTTGQRKGTAQPPPLSAFPLPYGDNFEKLTPNHTPLYLSDQDGAFEVHPCLQRTGQCLEQVISSKPIPWFPLPDPFTMAGDTAWMDYAVSADVRFLTASPVAIMGRIDSADVFQDSSSVWPSGYVFRINRDGQWELLSVVFKKKVATLASGKVVVDPEKWHRVGLRFKGKQITATLDDAPLGTVEDATHGHGMFALGTGWDHAQFDNLSVVP